MIQRASSHLATRLAALVLAAGLLLPAVAVEPPTEPVESAEAVPASPGQPTFTEGLWSFLLDAPYLPIPWPSETWSRRINLRDTFGAWEFEVGGTTIDLTPTKHTIFLWLSALLCLLLFIPAKRKYDDKKVPSSKAANFVEALVLFVRDEMAIANIGKKEGPRYVPFLLTVFFLILFMNLLSLVPYGTAATANLAVTGALAIASFIITQIAGMRAHGPVGYWTGLVPSGVPWFLYPIMIPIEIMGLFTKPFALMVRLFANMTAGKVVIFSLIGLIFLFETVAVSPISVAFTLFILVLKLFVSFLQAYIFTMLTSLFIGMASHAH
jgi:F-type H+-transporting ATPase subunit a